MDEIPPAAREQMRLEPTLQAALDYGDEQPDEFGGVHWASDPMRVVFWVTSQLDDHLNALQRRVRHPDRVEVRRSAYTKRQVDVWLDEAYRLLYGRTKEPRVSGWGRCLGDDGFGVEVWIWPWSDEGAEAVRRELAPIPITVAEQAPIIHRPLLGP